MTETETKAADHLVFFVTFADRDRDKGCGPPRFFVTFADRDRDKGWGPPRFFVTFAEREELELSGLTKGKVLFKWRRLLQIF